MAKHKAPVDVTVAPLFEKSGFEKLVDKYKVPAVAVLVGIVGWVVGVHLSKQAAQRERDQSWELLISRTTPDPLTRLPTAPAEALAGLAVELKDRESGPWTRLLEAHKRASERDYSGAIGALESLRSEHPDHLLVRESLPTPGDRDTAVSAMEAVLRERQAWEDQHPGLFANPEPPGGSPQVTIQTGAGSIVVALFADLAPRHVENFLELCDQGFYDGTRFHRIARGFMIQGGDPNSRDDDPSTWGQGGTDYTIPPEPNDLAHFAGVLSAAKKPGETESSGSQFFITSDPAHHLDGQHVVFGTVVSGMDVVNTIVSAPLAPGATDRPSSPVAIESTQVSR